MRRWWRHQVRAGSPWYRQRGGQAALLRALENPIKYLPAASKATSFHARSIPSCRTCEHDTAERPNVDLEIVTQMSPMENAEGTPSHHNQTKRYRDGKATKPHVVKNGNPRRTLFYHRRTFFVIPGRGTGSLMWWRQLCLPDAWASHKAVWGPCTGIA